jgi:hypothetical protein
LKDKGFDIYRVEPVVLPIDAVMEPPVVPLPTEQEGDRLLMLKSARLNDPRPLPARIEDLLAPWSAHRAVKSLDSVHGRKTTCAFLFARNMQEGYRAIEESL